MDVGAFSLENMKRDLGLVGGTHSNGTYIKRI
jgi:hypothetical protein